MRKPDVLGPAGEAWLVKAPLGGPPDWAACLSTWVLQRPGAHPFWQWWMVSVIHLRDLPGVDPAAIRVRDASHEFFIAAFDPSGCPPDVEMTGPRGWRVMTPYDLEHQVAGLSDFDAAQIARRMILAIVDGIVSPDQDYAGTWRAVLNAAAADVRAGGSRP